MSEFLSSHPDPPYYHEYRQQVTEIDAWKIVKLIIRS